VNHPIATPPARLPGRQVPTGRASRFDDRSVPGRAVHKGQLETGCFPTPLAFYRDWGPERQLRFGDESQTSGWAVTSPRYRLGPVVWELRSTAGGRVSSCRHHWALGRRILRLRQSSTTTG